MSTATAVQPRLFDFASSGLPRTPFHLTADQVKSYDDNGFLILRKHITGRLLERLQEAGTKWIADGLKGGAANIIDGTAGVHDIVKQDYNFARRSTGKTVMFAVNYLHNKQHPASLELLGSPQVLAVAESLNGPNFVPTYESMVFKQAGDGEIIAWHQDAVFERNFRTWNFDVYLDRSSTEGGALRVIPRTQKVRHDVCQFSRTWQWNHPDQIVIEMEPGDVLVHDDMVLHGSPPTAGDKAKLRRTIYYEFRSVEQIKAEGPWDYAFADQRLRLIPLAMKRFREQCPDHPQFRWNLSSQFMPEMSGDESTELKVVHTTHTSGSYCSATSTPKTV